MVSKNLSNHNSLQIEIVDDDREKSSKNESTKTYHILVNKYTK
ncbi:22850_t:CDS:2 [Cetraspora pellucida]|uniref:22850_t:CDS:1 n=1 Tax=Cetraspora pellucida TaxID=1433469 RepID=A0A9N8ZIN0_9GLOM|nr:22850_t:CDS:2 [Cetraspora pellucida]